MAEESRKATIFEERNRMAQEIHYTLAQAFAGIGMQLQAANRFRTSDPLTVNMGLRKLKKWLSYAQIIFGSVAQTIRRHLVPICNYFVSRTTSGVMEGINNKIKLILRQSYGFTNFDNLRELVSV